MTTAVATPEQALELSDHVEDDPSALVRAENVDKTYVTRQGPVTALKGASISVQRGTFISLVGPSGCGKSTLLKIIGGLIPKTGGEVLYRGRQVEGPNRDIGMMFQTPTLFPWRTILENVMLPIEIFKRDTKTHLEKAKEVLEMVGLKSFENCYPRELSGGMQQRAALSRVLIFEPHLLLMDEPFGALDEFNRERLNLEILRVWGELKQTVIFVTHNIAEAVFLADELYVMSPSPGRVIGHLTVNLERPRTFGSMHEPEFVDKVYQVRDLLGVAR
jgi:NitT/TauT family transport system ATP-binding protein